MQRYTYMRLVDLDHYRKIFIGEFDSELLIKIMQTILAQVIENPEFNNETEQKFIFDFLTVIQGTPSFSFSLEFLGTKERELIHQVIKGLSLLPEDQQKSLAEVFQV